jgi:hypothetical protein
VKALAAILAVALVALGVTGGNLWRDLRAERVHNRELAAGPQPVQVAPGPAPASPAPGQPVLPAAPVEVPEGVPAAPVARSVAPQTGTVIESTRQLLASPEGQEFQRTMMRTVLAQQYPDLETALGMTAEQAAGLLELLGKHAIADAAVQQELLAEPEDPAERAAMYRRMDARERANEREIEELLGSRYQQWQEYQRAASNRQRDQMQRQQSQLLRAAVSSERNPLSDAQFESLSAALTAEGRRMDEASIGQSMRQQLDGVAERNRRMAAVAADYLNAEQLAQYRAYLEQQAASMRAMMDMMSATEK